ncbi:hypothetical protein BD414DRAFT_66054 [Trametes punicea]|nr:hypothetical protein BD414DRAFT_66054 [Trametes punicea]
MNPMAFQSFLSSFFLDLSSRSSHSDSSPRSRHHPDREPTTLESFSRTIRNYVPSSIPIPTAAPSPPRVSRPVSFGSFLTPSTAPTVRNHPASSEAPDSWKRRGSDTSTSADARERLSWVGQHTYRGPDRDHDMPVFSLDDDVPDDGTREAERRTTRYPGVGDAEEILWAGWDLLADGEHVKPRSILILGYPTGLQLWDCSNLGTVSELLNLTGSQWGAVEFASVLPDPLSSRASHDEYRQKRPLIAFSSRTVNGTDFLVYSLRSHEVVKRLPLIGLTSIAASTQFIVLSTSNPPTLHVLSSCTLVTLYTISSASLAPFAYPISYSSSHTPNANDVLSSLDIDSPHAPTRHTSLRPIYSLSNRLLAYVSPISRPTASSPASAAPGRGHAHTSVPVPAPETTSPLKLGLGMGMSMSQADLGTAAVKIGGSVLSGMKTLGGLAISAARAGVSAAVAGERVDHHSPSSVGGTGSGGPFGATFFSKSAPAGTGSPREYQSAQDRRRRSLRMSPPTGGTLDSALPPPPASPIQPSTGCNIVVMDLQPLLGRERADPELVAQFTFARPLALSALKFSGDGTTLAVCSKDGHAVRVLQLCPTPRVLRRLFDVPRSDVDAASNDSTRDSGREHSLSAEPDTQLAESTQHVYTLRRGRTSAVVEDMEWAHEKLWFGMSTRKRTIHVFAINPLGGKPDGSSHFVGKVMNSQELVSTSTELSPLVRVRLRPVQGDAPCIPCAFTFVRSSDVIVPPSLLPPASVHFSASSSPSSVQSGGLSKPVSPAQRPTRPTNYKDLLVFDPMDGTLTLRRVFVERSAAGDTQAVVSGSIPVAGGMSISLPGMSTLSRSMGASPPGSGLGVSPRTASGLTQIMERGSEIVGRESVVGTWSLARGRDWPEVKQRLRSVETSARRTDRVVQTDWLSRAELSTFSTSPRVLPRLIYLSHQFAFHVLGEDYHALIRGAHLDVPSTKIEVRKPVEVSAFATAGDSDAFVQGHSSPHSLGGVPSSFDEPLASALSAPLHPLHPSPPVLPMLPNGTPGSSGPKSFINAIPIRHVAAGISDGMSEGLGRIRRELGRARRSSHSQSQSQSPRPSSDPVTMAAPSVPLEFDEEDELEDFTRHAVDDIADADAYTEADVISRSTSVGMGIGISVGATQAEVEVESSIAAGSAESGQSASVSTPSTTIEPLPADHDGELLRQGWGPEDQQAVEDAERFDDITVGFLDEEQESMRAAAAETEAKKGRKRRGARKR